MYKFLLLSVLFCWNNLESAIISSCEQDPALALQWFSAAKNGNLRLLKKLIGKIDVNLQDCFNWNALMVATHHGKDDVAKLLLQMPNINVNAQNNFGDTALIKTALFDHTNIAKLLLQIPNIKLNLKDNVGKTALEWAKWYKRKTIVALIENKIQELAKIALDAFNKNDISAVKSIIDQIGIENIIDKDGNSLLHKAFEKNMEEFVIFLLKTVKEPRELLNLRNKSGHIALELINPTSPLFCLCIELAYAPKEDFKTYLSKRIKSGIANLKEKFS